MVLLMVLSVLLIRFSSVNAYDGQMQNDELIVGKNILEAWLKAVENARESILIATYKLTSTTALDALVKAHKRGVAIKLILDGKEANKKKSLAFEARLAGLDVESWPTETLGELHAKFSVLDDKRVIFGSFNLTESAEVRNIEVFFSTDDLGVVQDFISAWKGLQESVRSANLPKSGN